MPASPTPADPPDRFLSIYDLYLERVYRYLLARTGSPAEAEDLTSETFCAAFESFARCRAGEEGPWVMGIARHKLVDYFRRSRPLLALDAVEDRPASQPSPEEASVFRIEMYRVSKALQKMTPDRAEALALHFFGGLNLVEVGQVMGKSEEAAKKLVQRALADLRSALPVQ